MKNKSKTLYNKNKNTLISIISLGISMLFLAFASSAIYNLFCKATGYGGKTLKYNEIKSNSNTGIGSKVIKMNFDSNIEKKLPWKFYPKNKSIQIRSGENVIVFYEALNLKNLDIAGTAIYNITPQKAGKYFVKIHCFCFEKQILKAKSKMLFPVSFYIDKAIDSDPEMKDVEQITLSYTFYKM